MINLQNTFEARALQLRNIHMAASTDTSDTNKYNRKKEKFQFAESSMGEKMVHAVVENHVDVHDCAVKKRADAFEPIANVPLLGRKTYFNIRTNATDTLSMTNDNMGKDVETLTVEEESIETRVVEVDGPTPIRTNREFETQVIKIFKFTK